MARILQIWPFAIIEIAQKQNILPTKVPNFAINPQKIADDLKNCQHCTVSPNLVTLIQSQASGRFANPNEPRADLFLPKNI